ncbi:MAG: hypothetical protein EBR82_20895 [Caulobacteraceae bacterium]|nr:hypothetical protein [Caulobacteraceae bacterium]
MSDLTPSKDLQNFNRIMNSVRTSEHSDREVAIISVSVLEAELRALLCTKLTPDADQHEPLFGLERPLAGFTARIALGRALGLLDAELVNNLKMAARVRNEFAHSMEEMSFDHSKLDKAWAGLTLKTAEKLRERFVEEGLEFDDCDMYVEGQKVSFATVDPNNRVGIWLSELADDGSRRSQFLNCIRLLWYVMAKVRLDAQMEAQAGTAGV